MKLKNVMASAGKAPTPSLQQHLDHTKQTYLQFWTRQRNHGKYLLILLMSQLSKYYMSRQDSLTPEEYKFFRETYDGMRKIITNWTENHERLRKEKFPHYKKNGRSRSGGSK
jgi:hypothetical protein